MTDRAGASVGIEMRLLQLQMLSLIYLQKLAIGPQDAQVSVPLVSLALGIAAMALCNRAALSPVKLVAFAVFVLVVALSQLLAAGPVSIPSLLFLLVLYGCAVFRFALSHNDARRLMDTFVSLMLLPAAIVLFQYAFQTATGLGNPLNMDRLVPAELLLRGYIYEAPYPWGGTFSRPNGFFFLETSFASAFCAAAAIIELSHFRRVGRSLLLLSATVASLGGTGIGMLLIAAPFLAMRFPAPVVALVVAAGAFVLVLAVSVGVPLPMVARLAELGVRDSSAYERLIAPAQVLLDLVNDPRHMFTGTGAGTVSSDAGNAWPSTKLLQEYGLAALIAFEVFFLCGNAYAFNPALITALLVIYHFTGGYLLSPVMAQFVFLSCGTFAPAPSAPEGRSMMKTDNA